MHRPGRAQLFFQSNCCESTAFLFSFGMAAEGKHSRQVCLCLSCLPEFTSYPYFACHNIIVLKCSSDTQLLIRYTCAHLILEVLIRYPSATQVIAGVDGQHPRGPRRGRASRGARPVRCQALQVQAGSQGWSRPSLSLASPTHLQTCRRSCVMKPHMLDISCDLHLSRNVTALHSAYVRVQFFAPLH